MEETGNLPLMETPLLKSQPMTDSLGTDDSADASLSSSETRQPSETGLAIKLRALRIHQWVKNALLFVPLFLGHEFLSFWLFLKVLIAGTAFCLTASSVYLLNDMVDLEADRAHPTKRNRPFASGALPLSWGKKMIPLLLGGSIILCFGVSWSFFVVLFSYYLLTVAYSFSLKQKPLIDVVVLASLYTLRIIAGTEAAGLQYSFWLLAYSLFLFLSLAFVKRYSELYNMRTAGDGRKKTRGYSVDDMNMLATMGATGGYLSVLIFSLYINSPEVRMLYRHPQLLWAICPLLLFWISRIWLLTSRGQMNEDPIVFALKDTPSYAVGILTGLVAIIASW